MMKPLRLTMAAIATFCCSTLLQAQALDSLIDIDALFACDCELVVDPVCVDLGLGVTFPAPNACLADCLGLPVVEGGDCMTPEALAFWAAFFGLNPDDLQDIEDLEDMLEDFLDDFLDDADDDDDYDGDDHDGDHDDDDADDDDDYDGDDDDGDDDDSEGNDDDDDQDWDWGDWGDWDGSLDGDSLGVDTLDGDWGHHGGDWDDDDHGGCDDDTLSTDTVITGGAIWQGWNVEQMHYQRGDRRNHGTAFEGRSAMEDVVLDVFPNPTQDWVTARIPAWAEELRLIHRNGRVVQSWRVSDSASWMLDVSNLPGGLYHVVVTGEGHRLTTSMVVAK